MNHSELFSSIDPSIGERIEALAGQEQLEVDRVVEAALEAGIEALTTGSLAGDVDHLKRRIADVEAMLHVAGPAALGTAKLLTYWMAKSPGMGADEDDLASAYDERSKQEWALALARLGIVAPTEQSATNADAGDVIEEPVAVDAE